MAPRTMLLVLSGIAVTLLAVVVVPGVIRSDEGEPTASSTSVTTTTSTIPTTTTTIVLTTTATSPTTTTTIPADVEIEPGEPVGEIVESLPPGSVVLLRAGRHEGALVVPKDGMTFIGEPGAVMDGLGVTEYAFVGTGANDVTIQGLEITGYVPPVFPAGSPRQVFSHAAVTSLGYDGRPDGIGRNWTVVDVDVHHNLAGVFLGDGGVVRESHFHHNDQIGVKLSWADSGLVEWNEISFNNEDRFYDIGYEAGGAKFTNTTNLVVRNNHVHDNGGPGLWTDIDNVDTLYEGNLVTDNAWAGIEHEISYSGRIIDNIVTGNGFEGPGWMFGAGILIATSSDVVVEGNTVVGNYNAIGIIQQDRGTGRLGEWKSRNIIVRNNTVRTDGWVGAVQDNGDDAVFADGNIVFEDNTYTFLPGAAFHWDNNERTWSEWQEAGNDATGSFNELEAVQSRSPV